jgi:hypothetical protein
MNLNKALGVSLALVGIGLIVWGGLASWKGEISKPALIGRAPTPTTSRRAEPIVPTAPPAGSSIPGKQSSTGVVPSPTPTRTSTPMATLSRQLDPPTSTPSSTGVSVVTQTLKPRPTDSPTSPSATPEVTLTSPPMMSGALSRFGVGAPVPYLSLLETQAAEELNLGWYLTWLRS